MDANDTAKAVGGAALALIGLIIFLHIFFYLVVPIVAIWAAITAYTYYTETQGAQIRRLKRKAAQLTPLVAAPPAPTVGKLLQPIADALYRNETFSGVRPPPSAATAIDWGRYVDQLSASASRPSVVHLAHAAVKESLQNFLITLPDLERGEFHTRAIDVIADVGGAINEIVLPFYADELSSAGLFTSLRSQLNRNIHQMSDVPYVSDYDASPKLVLPSKHKGTPTQLVHGFRFSDATADLVKIFNNGTVRGLPVLRTVTNRHREFNPAAFKVFGPKIIAMRGSFEDPALESRFLTEETGTRPLRADIPLHLPESLHREARELRNRLLHFRLCNLFSIKVDPALADRDLAPRFNQITLSLLSLIDDPELRRDIQGGLRQEHRRILHNRSLTLEAKVRRACRLR